jgi:hypothetical protein
LSFERKDNLRLETSQESSRSKPLE